MTAPVSTVRKSSARDRIIDLLHLVVIILSVVLIYAVTYDTLHNVSLLTDVHYLDLQLFICLFFIFEIIVEWGLRPHKLKRLPTTLAMLLICVPYISVIHHFGWSVNPELYYVLRIFPIIRAATVLVVMWDLLERNWITGMFGSYIIILVITLYVLSLMFFVEEHHVNPQVYNYWQSLWFSIMQMNTCGSNISPVTSAGKVIGVILSGEGLILFPVFTVFITQAFGKVKSDSGGSQPLESES